MKKKLTRLIVLSVVVVMLLSSCAMIPKVVEPKNSFHLKRIDPVFTWNFKKMENLQFEFQIAEDSNFTKNKREFLTTHSFLKLSLPYLIPGKKYYWKVRAVYIDNRTGITLKTEWSYANAKQNIPHFFYVDNDAVGYTGFYPILKNPEQNEKLMTLKPEFLWEFPDHSNCDFKIKNVNGDWVFPKYEETTYSVQLASDEDFSNDLKQFEIKNARKSFKLSIPYLNKGQEYFWRVKAKYFDPYINDYRESDYSVYKPLAQEMITQNIEDKPYSFIVSKNARGDFGLEVGQEEEVSVSKISENVTQLTINEHNDWFPAVSPNGQTLAFCSDRDSGSEVMMSEIYYINLSGRQGTGERRKTFSNPGIKNLNPFWLQDNENVGFYSNRLRNDPDLYNLFYSNRGKGVSYINDGINYVGDGMGYLKKGTLLTGCCSKDNKIVYTVKTEFNNDYSIWLFNKEENTFTQLISGVFPNIRENKIVYSIPKSKTNWNIWIMDLDGTTIFNETQLTSEIDVKDYDPAISPDGSKIAYASDRNSNADIWIMNSDGTNQRQLTYNPMPDRKPVWLDNGSIVFQSKRGRNKDGLPQWDIFLLKIPE